MLVISHVSGPTRPRLSFSASIYHIRPVNPLVREEECAHTSALLLFFAGDNGQHTAEKMRICTLLCTQELLLLRISFKCQSTPSSTSHKWLQLCSFLRHLMPYVYRHFAHQLRISQNAILHSPPIFSTKILNLSNADVVLIPADRARSQLLSRFPLCVVMALFCHYGFFDMESTGMD